MALSIELLEELLEETAKELLKRVKSGEADGQDMSNVMKMLNQNSVVVVRKNTSALKELSKKLAKRRIKKPATAEREVTPETLKEK